MNILTSKIDKNPTLCPGFLFLLITGVMILASCNNNRMTPTGTAGELVEANNYYADTTNTESDTTDESGNLPENAIPNSDFTVFDGTRFRNKPDLTQYGFESIEVIYANRLWPESMDEVDEWELPSKDLIFEQAHQAKKKNNRFTVLDIEHWPNHGDLVALQKSLTNYLQVLQDFNEAEPDLKVGYWGTLPIKKRYMSSPPNLYYLQLWQGNNDKLAPLAEQVDAFFPHLYTYSNDQQQWVTNAKYTIQEAKRYNKDKPVYVFLWPQYYSIDHPELKNEYIDKDFWRLQLQTARKYADGIVIWFPYKTQWEEASQAPWWNVTKEFLQDVKASSP